METCIQNTMVWLCQGFIQAFAGISMSITGIFSCSLPRADLRGILTYMQAGFYMSISSNSSPSVLCDFSPAMCHGPLFSVSPKEASGGMRAVFPTI